MSAALNFGYVWIDTSIPLIAETPQGGFGHSGYAKDLSMCEFEGYTRTKPITSATS